MAVAGEQSKSRGDRVRQADHARVQAKNNMRRPHPVWALAKQENNALTGDRSRSVHSASVSTLGSKRRGIHPRTSRSTDGSSHALVSARHNRNLDVASHHHTVLGTT